MKKHLTCLAAVVAFAKVRKWPQGEKETSVLMRSLITISESPSRIKGDEPSSRPKEIALATAKASTICEEYGRCTSSKRKQWSVPKSCESQFSQFPGQLFLYPWKFHCQSLPWVYLLVEGSIWPKDEHKSRIEELKHGLLGETPWVLAGHSKRLVWYLSDLYDIMLLRVYIQSYACYTPCV